VALSRLPTRHPGALEHPGNDRCQEAEHGYKRCVAKNLAVGHWGAPSVHRLRSSERSEREAVPAPTTGRFLRQHHAGAHLEWFCGRRRWQLELA
jgi:hypothetical protein